MPRKKSELPWLDERNGVYYAFWYDSRKRRTERLSLRTSDPSQAKSRFAAFLVEGCDIYEPTPSHGKLTTAEAIDHYLEHHVRLKSADPARIEDALHYPRQFFGEKPVGEIDIPTCRTYTRMRVSGQFHDRRRAEPGDEAGVAEATVRRELGALRAALNHASRWKLMAAEDHPVIELPQNSAQLDYFPTWAEVQAMRAVATPRLRDFIDLAYYTGARRRSIETLTVFQVDLRNDRIALKKQGERTTTKRRPTVPIFPEIRPTVERLVREARENGTEYLLGNDHSIYPAWRHAKKRAGADERFTPHGLRHARATHLLQSGTEPWAVANLLGDSLKTVLEKYGHYHPDYLAETFSRSDSGSKSGS